MIEGHDISLFSTAPFGVFTTSTQDAKTRRQLCACAVNLSDENRMLHSIVAELSASLAKMQTMYALQSQVLHTQQELIIALGKETTAAGRAASLPARAEWSPFDDTRSRDRRIPPTSSHARYPRCPLATHSYRRSRPG